MEVLLIVAAFIIASMVSSARGKQTWESVAADVGLTYTKAWPHGQKLHGERHGFDVVVDRVSRDKQTKIRATISGLDPDFTLGRDSAFQRMLKPDIETGDQLFDERTRIEGDADWALALLGEEARRLTEIVISGWSGELRDGALVALYDDIQSTASTLDTLLDLAQLLRKPSHHELPKLLLERARHDPSDPVRLQAFRQLAAAYEFREEAIEAAEMLLDSSSGFVSLEACRLLVKSSSEKSELAAEELARLATGPWDETSVRRSAIETLVESRHRQTTIPMLCEILRQLDTPSVVRSAALEGLIRAGARAELLDVQIDGETEAEILARGLGRFDVSVQPRLLQLLDGSGSRARLAAVRSLGTVGDLDAILALRRIADRGRPVQVVRGARSGARHHRDQEPRRGVPAGRDLDHHRRASRRRDQPVGRPRSGGRGFAGAVTSAGWCRA